MLVLIPAYEPGDSLIALVRELRAHPASPSVLVVDDGSGPDHDEIFALARIHGATVHRYQENRGKGHALKTGFAIARRYHPGEVVVCADSDGQHKVPDIMRVAREVDVDSREMVLGGRRFTGRVPLRSAFGNKVTSWLFKTLTAIRVGDTQTGLRAYPPSMLEWLGTIPGERFEYELSLLLQARKAGISIREIEIETVYLHGNRSSHFRPIRDSWRVYRPLLAFAGSSLAGFAVDFLALLFLMAVTHNLLFSVITARLLSATVNYLLNRHAVFRDGDRSTPVRYALLACGILAANYMLLRALSIVMPLVAAKLLTEFALFAISFAAQRALVFTHKELSTRKGHLVTR